MTTDDADGTDFFRVIHESVESVVQTLKIAPATGLMWPAVAITGKFTEGIFSKSLSFFQHSPVEPCIFKHQSCPKNKVIALKANFNIISKENFGRGGGSVKPARGETRPKWIKLNIDCLK